MGFTVRFFRVLFAFLLLVGCSKNHQPIPQNINLNDKAEVETIRSILAADASIMVVDQKGQAVVGAEIQIDNNSFATDSGGILKIPASWQKEASVLIKKDGFINTAYLKQKPEAHIYSINLAKTQERYEVEGNVTGFGQLPSDGFVDFALVISSLDVASSLNFDITKMISPEMDEITVYGKKLQIPTNVFLPKQKESYGIFPITIEKAFYSLFFDFTGDYKIHTNRGKFDLDKVSSKLQGGGNFFEAVNDFQFLSIGTQNVSLSQPKMTANLDSNKMPLSPKLDFTMPAPQGSNSMLFGISMFEEDGRLIASDIKLRNASVQKLSLPQNTQKNFQLLALTSKEQVTRTATKLSHSMSTALVPADKISKAYLIDRVPAPVAIPNGVQMQEPILKGNLKDFATYVTLSTVQTTVTKRYSIERKDILWEIYSPGWIGKVELPQIVDRDSQRWDVVFFGIDSTENKQFNGPTSLNQATHAVHNAVDF